MYRSQLNQVKIMGKYKYIATPVTDVGRNVERTFTKN